MTANAASDLVLGLACGWVVATRIGRQPGFGLAALLIGIAAALGVLRYTGVDVVSGAHRFASLTSACAAFLLIAWALRWPDDPIVITMAGAVRAAMLAAGVGIGATVLGLSAWGAAISVSAALLISVTMVQRRNGVGVAGAAALVIAMAASALGKAAPFNAIVVLHVGLAAALLLLARASDHRSASR